MKIAMLSTMYPFRGGIAQSNANLYQALKQEHEVLPFTFSRQYPDFLFPGKTQYVTEADKAIPIDSIPVLDTFNPFNYLSAARRIAEAKPDLLLLRYWMSYFAPSLGTVANRFKKQGCKVITVLDNVVPHEPKFFDKPMTTWFLKQNSGFVAMCDSVRRDLLSLHPKAMSILKPHPLYNHFGEKLDRDKACDILKIDKTKKTILFFGLIRDYKGLDLLIDAMNELDESYQLVIAGEAYGSFDKYTRQIAQTNSPERIHVFNRYIDDEEVPAFFSAADVCVLPYRSATQSGVASIAYHFETPLIATRTGGLDEAIEAPGVGLMVPEITAQSIAATVQKFYQQDRSLFIENIRKEKKNLSWEAFSKDLIAFAERL